MKAGLKPALHEAGLGFAAEKETWETFADPEALHGADLGGDGADVSGGDRRADGPHLGALGTFHAGTAIEDDGKHGSLDVAVSGEDAGECLRGHRAEARQGVAQEDSLRGSPWDGDPLEGGGAGLGGSARHARCAGERETGGVWQGGPIGEDAGAGVVADVVADADSDAGRPARPARPLEAGLVVALSAGLELDDQIARRGRDAQSARLNIERRTSNIGRRSEEKEEEDEKAREHIRSMFDVGSSMFDVRCFLGGEAEGGG